MTPNQERRRRRRDESLENVLRYIDAHLSERLDIAVLAGVARISPFHFHRIFSAHVGETVAGYVRRQRLERAARLILLNHASIGETAAMSGYATAAGFTRAFKRHFGLSPSRMQREFSGGRGVPADLPLGIREEEDSEPERHATESSEPTPLSATNAKD
jgi:AraC-like DNA-binding protein